jgi:HSP20 family protein
MLIGGNFMADTLKVSPTICAYPDDKYENLEIEVVLPGVEKKDISFKIDENGVLKVTVPYQEPFEEAVDVKIE